MKKDIEFYYIGKNTEGKSVICYGLWDFYQTNGLPIEIQADKAWESGFIISWIHEYNMALWKGCTHEKFMNFISELSMSKYYRDSVLKKLNMYIKQREISTPFNYEILTQTKELVDGKQ